ncbi:rRNA maturation RNase YbeY [bacterium]|nr:rRNA maturation RNase YbeY [bacterium]
MTNLNVFIEDTYDEYNIDEVLVYNNVVKMTEFIFDNKTIMSKSCLDNLDYDTVTFDIVLVNNDEIHRINKEYRDKDKPTDVITFAIFADSPEEEQYIFDGEINLGEIIVSLDKIAEQAKENNVGFYDELYYIISHGILHLLGFDHQTEDEYNFMVDNQNKAKAVVL